MTTLGIGLIVIGVALVCGGLILRPRASQREDEDHADSTMADVLRRLNESSDADPLNKQYAASRSAVPMGIAMLMSVLNGAPIEAEGLARGFGPVSFHWVLKVSIAGK